MSGILCKIRRKEIVSDTLTWQCIRLTHGWLLIFLWNANPRQTRMFRNQLAVCQPAPETAVIPRFHEMIPIALLLVLGHTVLYAEAGTVYRQAPLQKN
jgi:hypothetical protein